MPLYGYADGRNYLLMPSALANPLALTLSGKLFTKKVSGVVELFYLDDNGVEHQLTPASPGSIYPYQLPIIPFAPPPLALNGKLYTRVFTPPGGGEACLCFMSNTGVEYVLTPGYNQDFAPLVMSEVAIIPATQANKGLLYTKDVAGQPQLFYLTDAAVEYQITPPSGGGGASLIVAAPLKPHVVTVVVQPGFLQPLVTSAVDSTITFADGVNDGDRAGAACYHQSASGGKIFINRGTNISQEMWDPANLYLDFTAGQLKAIVFVWSASMALWCLESASVY